MVERADELVIHVEDDLTSMGVRIGDGLLHDSNAEWYVLQEQVRPRQDNRAKCGILDMSTDDVYFTQNTCSEYFRTGMALAHLIEQLRH